MSQSKAAQMPLRVGLMDADIYGPSIPLLMNLKGMRAETTEVDDDADADSSSKLIPLENYGIKCMSMGFMVEEQHAAVRLRVRLSVSSHDSRYGAVRWSALQFSSCCTKSTGVNWTCSWSICLRAQVTLSCRWCKMFHWLVGCAQFDITRHLTHTLSHSRCCCCVDTATDCVGRRASCHYNVCSGESARVRYRREHELLSVSVLRSPIAHIWSPWCSRRSASTECTVAR